jgi:O-antigen/teichoic acid export membrane protein
MDVSVIAVCLPIFFAIGIVISIVYLRRYDNMERMAMIEKGVSPDIFQRKSSPSAALRSSLLLIGIGLGLLIGYALDRSFEMDEVGYFSMIFILGGVGLGLAYLVEEKKAK